MVNAIYNSIVIKIYIKFNVNNIQIRRYVFIWISITILVKINILLNFYSNFLGNEEFFSSKSSIILLLYLKDFK